MEGCGGTSRLFLVLIILFLLPTCAGQEFKSSLVIASTNYRLHGHTIRRHQTRGILQCGQRCLTLTTCGGYNYKATVLSGLEGLCELVGSLDTKEGSLKLVESQGWISGKMRSEETKFTFTSLRATGGQGPTNTNGYTGTSLEGQVQVHQGIQTWVVPETGYYVIEALGASGGNGTNTTIPRIWRKGGLGARIKGTFFLNRGQPLKILVGQEGETLLQFAHNPGSGGGGTFVTLPDNTPLVVAGGGGGGAAPGSGWQDGDDGQASENGTSSGGFNGSGGRRVALDGISMYSSAGGGLLTDGEGEFLVTGGKSFINGGAGGINAAAGPVTGSRGGFGGGGGCNSDPGGGGGYSGGGVTKRRGFLQAGGGGSFNGGIVEANEAGVNKGHGRVTITILP